MRNRMARGASIAALVMCLASPVLGQAAPGEPAPDPAPPSPALESSTDAPGDPPDAGPPPESPPADAPLAPPPAPPQTPPPPAPPPATAAAPPPAYDAEIAPEYDYPEGHREPSAAPCALAHLCLGPVLTLGVPNLIGIGAHARITKFVGVGVDYQFLPTFGIEGVPVDASSFTIEGRLYPTGDSFFVGAGFAYQSVTAEGRRLVDHPDGGQVTLAGEGELGLPLLKLGIGWLGYDGFVIGIDLAIEIPLGTRKLEITTTGSDGSEVFDEEVAALRRTVQDQADNVLDLLPVVIQLNFLRLGYMF
jgi:hypothetical protein